ncbi:MAG: hypothetical protein ACRESZ_03310 [Methylococcales bacterium]
MSEPALAFADANDRKHTFLFDESVWLVSGIYINEKSVSVEVEGDSVISHRDGSWFNEVSIELKIEDNRDYRNHQYKTRFEYSPIESLMEPSDWHASNAVLGRLHGVLVFVDDLILSSYQNTNGNIRGMESMRRISEYEYQCRGALIEGGRRSSSWVLRYDKG